MALRYDARAEAYVGERYRVEQGTFLRSLTRLLDVGWEPEAALDYLLDEDNWSAALRGVEPLVEGPSCGHCGAALRGDGYAYCDVVCEATSHLQRCLDGTIAE